MKKINITLIIAVLLVFFLGYYLRAYNSLHTYLPYSPYEAYISQYNHSILNQGQVTDFTDKAARYPTTLFFQRIFNPLFGNLYLIYIFGAIAVFLLGKEITGNYFGGFLSFCLFAFSSENLLSYTRTIGASGLCYVFMWLSFFFAVRHLKGKKKINLIFFIVFSLLTLTSYHTGASSFAFILLGILISLLFSKEKDGRIIISLISLIFFHIIWVVIFDISQLQLLIKLFESMNALYLIYLVLAGLFLLIMAHLSEGKKVLESEYFPLAALGISAILIFSKSAFFDFLFVFAVKNYYVSTISLNNYIAQAILTHVYFLPFFAMLFKKNAGKEQAFLRGWLIGLFFISLALIFNGYYSRIFDYSFPLMFILFGGYWSKRKRYRSFIVIATIFLLIISQVIIYNDPFSMRRYYTEEEIHSVQKIIALNLNGSLASDLRTSAIFSYLGKKDVKFADTGETLHDSIFYEYKNVGSINAEYVILTESMRSVVYSTNFPTKPLSQKDFNYYKNNYEEIYNDNQMYVYKIK